MYMTRVEVGGGIWGWQLCGGKSALTLCPQTGRDERHNGLQLGSRSCICSQEVSEQVLSGDTGLLGAAMSLYDCSSTCHPLISSMRRGIDRKGAFGVNAPIIK